MWLNRQRHSLTAMSTQERVNQLANAALRSNPTEGKPKPATFMPSFEQMRSATPVLPKAPAPATRISVALNAFDLAFSTNVPGHQA
jgi:hypothetical protein